MAQNGLATAGLVWSSLLAGAALVGYPLVRNVRRFRQWKLLKQRHSGEVAVASQVLRPGLVARLAPREGEHSASAPETVHATLQGLREGCITLVLHWEPSQARPAMDEYGETLWFAVGSSIQVTVQAVNALYPFEADVQKLERMTGEPNLWQIQLSGPFWVARIQRRAHVRTELSGEVVIQPIENQSGTSPLRTAKLLNLSGGGFCAEIGPIASLHEVDRLLEELRTERSLRSHFRLPGLSGTILVARVRTAERTALSGGIGIQVACEFVELPSWERELVIQQVFRVQKETLRHRQKEAVA